MRLCAGLALAGVAVHGHPAIELKRANASIVWDSTSTNPVVVDGAWLNRVLTRLDDLEAGLAELGGVPARLAAAETGLSGALDRVDALEAGGGAIKFSLLSSPPATCSAAAAGSAYYDTAKFSVQVCNGVEWQGADAQLGTASSPALSCKAIMDSSPASKSGLYYIDADGTGGPKGLREEWCEMNADGGGWTRVVKCAVADNCYVGGAYLWVTSFTANDFSDAVTAGTTKSYLSGSQLAAATASATEFMIAVTDGTTTEYMVMPLGPVRGWFHSPGAFFQSGDFTAKHIKKSDWSTDMFTLCLCYTDVSTDATFKVRSMKGQSGHVFLGKTSESPSASAGSTCDYGSWGSQILMRGPGGSQTTAWGSAPANSWGAAGYTHEYYVR